GVRVHTGHLAEHDSEIFVRFGELPDRGGDIGGCEYRGRHLIKQRLKNVMIAPVDYHDICIRISQGARRSDPSKSGAHDHHTLAARWRVDRGGYLIRPFVRKHRIHESPSCSLSSSASATPVSGAVLHRTSHSGLLEPRGTSTVLKEAGVFDRTIWSVI